MAWLKVIYKGTLGTTEVWSVGLSYGIVGLAPDVPDQALTDGVLANLKAVTTSGTFNATLRELIGTGNTIDMIRVELRAENETILSLSEGLLTVALAGTGTPSKTPQDAIVFSLRTLTPGARGRGRVYWPAIACILSSQFQLTTPTPSNTAIGAKTWMQSINTAIDNYFISIASAKRAALAVRSVTDHVCRDVTQIQVGTILDTQRRRRDALPESYSVQAYP